MKKIIENGINALQHSTAKNRSQRNEPHQDDLDFHKEAIDGLLKLHKFLYPEAQSPREWVRSSEITRWREKQGER